MTDRRFSILGTAVPRMLGREAVLQRILRALTKATPDHLQIVGPRFAGKTVILHELAHRLKEPGSPYTAVLLWDLGHQTPATDERFMQRFAQEFSKAIAPNHPDYAEHLKTVKDHPYEDIAEVMDALADEGKKVLAILDGFDKPLSHGQLTRNLWDQLRELALQPSLRMVTASRRTLRDLIRDPVAQTSDFWNIFEPSPVRIGCFDENDLTKILAQCKEFQLATGAKTELWNVTNGFPVLMLEILNILLQDTCRGELKPETILDAWPKALPALRDTIGVLWEEMPPSAQDLLLRVRQDKIVSRKGLPSADIETLVERGFVHQAGNNIERPCLLLTKVLDESLSEGSALARLFSTEDAYLQHLKGVLARRIAHLIRIDPDLKRMLERGVEDLPSYPGVFLSNVQGILERALALIWKSELEGLQIPSEWVSIWRHNNEKGFENWLTRFPEGGQRLRLLDLMTGTQKSDRCTKYVTKNTYVLANAVQGFRDFGVHPKDAAVDPGTAYAALHSCIELAASLTRELSIKN